MKKWFLAPLRLVGMILGSLLYLATMVVAILAITLYFLDADAPRFYRVLNRAGDFAQWLIFGPTAFIRARASWGAGKVLAQQRSNRTKFKPLPNPAPYPIPR